MERMVQKRKYETNTNIVAGCQHAFYQNQTDIISNCISSWTNKNDFVVESPTGTGKSIAVCCAMRNILSKYPNTQFVYLSRTHVQITQCIETLNKVDNNIIESKSKYFTDSNTSAPAVHLFSKKRACINYKVQQLFSKFTKNNNKRNDSDTDDDDDDDDLSEVEVNEVEEDKITDIEDLYKKIKKIKSFQTMCTYARLFKICNYNVPSGVGVSYDRNLSLDNYRLIGKRMCECPYELYKHDRREIMQKQRYVLFGPYIYITNPSLFLQIKSLIASENRHKDRRIILIIDEAHNFPSACMDGMSFTLKRGVLEKKIKGLFNIIYTENEKTVCKCYHNKDLIEFYKLLQDIDNIICNLFTTLDSYMDQQNHSYSLEENIQRVIDFDRLKCLNDIIESELLCYCRNLLVKVNDLTCTHAGLLIKTITSCYAFYEKIYYLLSNSNAYCPSIERKKPSLPTKLRLQCVDGSYFIRTTLKDTFDSITFMSGTLKPIEYLDNELCLSNPIHMSLGHIMHQPTQQFKIIIRDDVSIFTYNNKKHNPNIYRDACRDNLDTISNIIRRNSTSRSYGIFIFLTSKLICNEVCNHAMEYCTDNKIDILSNIQLDSTHILNAIKTSLTNSRYPIVFTYFRGGLAEGIDLTDDMCRINIIIGVPFINFQTFEMNNKITHNTQINTELNTINNCSEFVMRMKSKTKTHRDINRRSKQMATKDDIVTFDLCQSVGQVIGRTIRHQNDYGCCILYDKRWWSTSFYGKYLPHWTSNLIVRIKNQKECINHTEFVNQ